MLWVFNILKACNTLWCAEYSHSTVLQQRILNIVLDGVVVESAPKYAHAKQSRGYALGGEGEGGATGSAAPPRQYYRWTRLDLQANVAILASFSGSLTCFHASYLVFLFCCSYALYHRVCTSRKVFDTQDALSLTREIFHCSRDR